METKKYYLQVDEELHGPFTYEEMLEFDMRDDTQVTDDLESGVWKTAVDFGFTHPITNGHSEMPTSAIVPTLEGAEFLFRYKVGDDIKGPRSARAMARLSLSPDTPVTEASLNGRWEKASDFDFDSLAELENSTSEKGLSNSFFIGLIILIAGIGVTALTYSNAQGGGTYIIAWGAILTGIIMMLRG